MRVYPDQLHRQLGRLHPVYLIFGDDPWLSDACKSQIITAARKQGFDERITLNSQDTGFAWQQLEQEFQAMSLFAARRIIELQLPNAKPGPEGSAMLQSLLAQANPDTILLLIGPKLTAEQTKAKWFKVLDEQGIYLPCATPEGMQFQRWLDGRIQHFSLQLNRDAKIMLANLYEGNLLAADQALKLLQLLAPNQAVTVQDLSHYFEDQSRFSVFQLSDALLQNQQAKALHMLAQLNAEGTALPIVLWAMFKELTVLLQLKAAQSRGDNLNSLWGKLRIWDKRKPLYQGCLSRLSLEQLESMLSLASRLEIKLKQQGVEDWVGLSHLCILFDPSAHSRLAHITLEP